MGKNKLIYAIIILCLAVNTYADGGLAMQEENRWNQAIILYEGKNPDMGKVLEFMQSIENSEKYGGNANFVMGQIYDLGEGVERDSAKALLYYEKAANGIYARIAAARTAKLYEERGDLIKAKEIHNREHQDSENRIWHGLWFAYGTERAWAGQCAAVKNSKCAEEPPYKRVKLEPLVPNLTVPYFDLSYVHKLSKDEIEHAIDELGFVIPMSNMDDIDYIAHAKPLFGEGLRVLGELYYYKYFMADINANVEFRRKAGGYYANYTKEQYINDLNFYYSRKIKAAWTNAAQVGDGQAAFQLGVLYTEGLILPKDGGQARKWLVLSHELGYTPTGELKKYAVIPSKEEKALAGKMIEAAEYLHNQPRYAFYYAAQLKITTVLNDRTFSNPDDIKALLKPDSAERFIIGFSLESIYPAKMRADRAYKYLYESKGSQAKGVYLYKTLLNNTDYYAHAAYGLGYALHYGKGIKKNIPDAIYYYKIAQSGYVPDADAALGKIFEDGDGVVQDLPAAKQYYSAGSYGNRSMLAVMRRGFWYLNGHKRAEMANYSDEYIFQQDNPHIEIGYDILNFASMKTPPNVPFTELFGLEYLQKLTRYEFYKACEDFYWANLTYSVQNGRVGVMAEEQEFVAALRIFGDMSFYEYYMPRDYRDSFAEVKAAGGDYADYTYEQYCAELEDHQLSKAAEDVYNAWSAAAALGDAKAAFQLGTLYSKGTLFTKDLTEAEKWFKTAAKLGDPRAKAELVKFNL